jgi:hypothetical protein
LNFKALSALCRYGTVPERTRLESGEAEAKEGFAKNFSSGYSHISPDVLKSIIRVRPGGDFTGPTRFPFAGTRQHAGG